MIKIDINDLRYPQKLKNIKDSPQQLYLEGNIQLLKKPSIAIIGSRACTKYGERMAQKFSKELGEYGIITISGLAKGIDTCAHLGNIEKTIAVLPCGIKNIYPKENKKLYQKIIENKGLIITEYSEDIKADSNKFLERNRIVSGLSIGILVIEGGYRSGTSVTARLAEIQQKPIFCIPSSLENPKGITPNKLIKEGAHIVINVEDIIKEYPNLNLKKIETPIKQMDIEQISEEHKEIYDILDKENVLHINEVCKKAKLNINEVSYKLMLLELEDKVISLPGNNYRKK